MIGRYISSDCADDAIPGQPVNIEILQSYTRGFGICHNTRPSIIRKRIVAIATLRRRVPSSYARALAVVGQFQAFDIDILRSLQVDNRAQRVAAKQLRLLVTVVIVLAKQPGREFNRSRRDRRH